ncbi:Fur family transcriptional regulator [Brevibacillus sp. TJ4]|uniref:Fur family transcriptional regulator n=1 Tax=Brevibacillus sp. TJ4 TaxID=3234853 RepID=UPI0037DBFD7D
MEASPVNKMLDAMSRQGFRITDQRRTLAHIFLEDGGYLSPKDVYEKLSKFYPSVSLDTVYRNLRTLSDIGILEQFYFMDGGLKFKACSLNHHHHHLICMNCEKTVSFDYCPMDHLGGIPDDFKVINHRFEVYGLCESCQELSEQEKTSPQRENE